MKKWKDDVELDAQGEVTKTFRDQKYRRRITCFLKSLSTVAQIDRSYGPIFVMEQTAG